MGKLLTEADRSSYWGTYMPYFTYMYNNGISYYDILLNAYMLMGNSQYLLTGNNINNYCIDSSYCNHSISNGFGSYSVGTNSQGILYYIPYFNNQAVTTNKYIDRICVEPKERYWNRVFYFYYKITLSDGRIYGHNNNYRNGWCAVQGESTDITKVEYVLSSIPVSNNNITGNCEIFIIDSIATKNGSPTAINYTINESFTVPSYNQFKLIKTYKYSNSSPFYNINFRINFNSGDTLYINWGFTIISQIGTSIDHNAIGRYNDRTEYYDTSDLDKSFLISSFSPSGDCIIKIYIYEIITSGSNNGIHNVHGSFNGIDYDPLVEQEIHHISGGYSNAGKEFLQYTYNDQPWCTLKFYTHVHG